MNTLRDLFNCGCCRQRQSCSSSNCESCCNKYSCNPCCRGKSAYQIAVERGFKGTVDEWLESLQGDSAYEIAVANGYVGTINEWLNSIKGESGKSAYEIAVEQGYEGTEEEWLESLKGEFEPGATLFSISTPDGTAEVGFNETLNFISDSMDVSVDPATSAISIESQPVGTDIQFHSNAADARLQSSVSGGRAFTLLVGSGFESVENTGGMVTALIPLKSHKVLKASVIKEVHAMIRISLEQTDLPSTVYAQLFVASNFLSAEFTPIPETLMELGTFATGSPVGSALAASVKDLNINVPAESQLLLGFYNITAAGGLTAGTVGYLSGAARIEDK